MQSIPISQSVLSRIRRGFFALLIVTGLLMLGTALVLAAPASQSVENGKALFEAKCKSCHTIGGGQLVGPDLQGVTDVRESEWLARWILEPDKMIAEKDEIATELLAQFNNIPMPNSGLSEAEVADIIAYLDTFSTAEDEEEDDGEGEGDAAVAAPPPTPVPTPAPVFGDAANGQNLFTGATALANGGPACISCHNAGDAGELGGGTLGPDLTDVMTRYGDLGLEASLKGLPFPTMQEVFKDKPLTADEAADLLAYFAETNQSAPKPVNQTFVFFGLGGFVVMGVLGHLVWRKRLSGVRKPLVGR